MIFEIMDKNRNIDDNNDEQSGKHSDFSIDHILNRAGSSIVKNSENVEKFVYCEKTTSHDTETFDWLQCSRYCPPKIPRIHKKDVQKRQLGRHPRIPFTSYQLSVLEQKFRESPYLSSEEVIGLSKKLQLADIRVKIWFQNRRARERREKQGVFGENKSVEENEMADDKKNVSEEVLRKYSRPPGSTDAPSFRSRDLDSNPKPIKVENCQNQRFFTPRIKSEETSGPLGCSKTSEFVLPNEVGDIFKNAPYFLPNNILSQNVPLFFPIVNFSHSREDV